MNKSYLILFLFFLLVVPLAQAAESCEDNDDTFKQWDDIEFTNSIRVNGAPDDSLIANISFFDPTGKATLVNQEMTYNSANKTHNFTLFGRYNGNLGTHQRHITSTNGVLNNTSCFLYEVTPNGEKGLLGFYFLVIILSYGVIFLGIYKEDITITLLGDFSLFFVGIWILYFGLDVFKNYLTNGFALITLGIASYVGIRVAHEYIT